MTDKPKPSFESKKATNDKYKRNRGVIQIWVHEQLKEDLSSKNWGPDILSSSINVSNLIRLLGKDGK